jgi:hypothetical protein
VNGTATYWTTVSFSTQSHGPSAFGITTEMVDDPSLLKAARGHVTVSKRGVVDVELAVTCMDPAPVNGLEADASSGCCRSPTFSTGATGWTGAAATLELPLGDVVVVVVEVVALALALDCRAMTWTPSVVPVVVGADGEVGGVTVPGPCADAAVVVVVGGSAVDLALR